MAPKRQVVTNAQNLRCSRFNCLSMGENDAPCSFYGIKTKINQLNDYEFVRGTELCEICYTTTFTNDYYKSNPCVYECQIPMEHILIYTMIASELVRKTKEAREQKNPDAAKLRVRLLNPLAKIPTKGSEHSTGYDLYSTEEVIIPPRSKARVGTGLQLELPKDCYGRIAPRSGLAYNNFIDIGGGVIDVDYKGEVEVILFNHDRTPFVVQIGDRVAQLIAEKIHYPIIEVVDNDCEFDAYARGCGGFGFTGR